MPPKTHTHTLFQSIKQLHVLLNLYFDNSQTQVQMLSHEVVTNQIYWDKFLSIVA
jgi:hypothetical protein